MGTSVDPGLGTGKTVTACTKAARTQDRWIIARSAGESDDQSSGG